MPNIREAVSCQTATPPAGRRPDESGGWYGKQTGLANLLQQVCCNREEFIPSGIPGSL
jgi:hypothetical protein